MEQENKYIGTLAQEGQVAKSFVGWEITAEPAPNEKGALYIQVRNPANNNLRLVRFYAPKAVKATAATVPYNPSKRNMAYPFGFTTDKNGKDGTIILYANTDYETFKDLAIEHGFRWNKWFGWYAPAGVEPLTDEEMPEGVSTFTLSYSQISDENGDVLPDTLISGIVNSIIYTPHGEYFGNVGDRIDVTVTVTNNTEFTSKYGISHCITMEDAAGHTFVWFTSAKNWESGTIHHIRATIKDQSEYKGLRQTVITRAMEAK